MGGLKRGAWTCEEDKLLSDYIKSHGPGRWMSLPANAGLNRCGKSCRLRWLNYLRPDIKRGNITEDEDELIIRLHRLLGNRWSLIAGRLPGRTDNEIKNYWNTHLKKKAAGVNSGRPSSSKTSYGILPDANVDNEEAWIAELMRGSIFCQAAGDDCYAGSPQAAGISFDEESYMRGLFSGESWD